MQYEYTNKKQEKKKSQLQIEYFENVLKSVEKLKSEK